MKRILLLAVLLISVKLMFAQADVFVDDRLNARFTAEEIAQLIQTNPDEIQRMNFEVSQSFLICTQEDLYYLSKEELASAEKLCFWLDADSKGDEVTDVDFSDFNLYQYYFERLKDENKYYRIGDTNKILVVYPESALLKKYKE